MRNMEVTGNRFGAKEMKAKNSIGRGEPLWRDDKARARRKRTTSTQDPQLYIKLALVIDRGTTDEDAKSRALNLARKADETFRQLNVRVLLSAFQESNSTLPGTVSSPPSTESLRRQLLQDYGHTADRTVDLAFVVSFTAKTQLHTETKHLSICGRDAPAGGAIQVPSHLNSEEVGIILSREIGRSLGFLDDTDVCRCEQPGCLMNTSVQRETVGLSSCTLHSFRDAYESGKLWCLEKTVDKNELIQSPLCGNGIVEAGEDCDCTGSNVCSECCRNCTLVDGAQCAGGPCCSEECRFVDAGSRCRDQRSACDIAEYCTGTTGQGVCMIGVCQTRLQQCMDLWGQGSKAGASTCSLNTTYQGADVTEIGSPECSFLMCDVTEVNLSSPRVQQITALSTWTSGEPTCRATSLRLTDGSDLGHVTDGVLCGENEVCVSGTCRGPDRESCEVGPKGRECSDNGVCTSSSRCICHCGWAGPACSSRNETRAGAVCLPEPPSNSSKEGEAVDDEGNEGENTEQVRILTNAIIGGSLATIFIVAIIFGATSIGFKRAKRQNQARRRQQVKLFSMFQPTKEQQKRLAKFDKGRPYYTAGTLDGDSKTSNAGSSHQQHPSKPHRPQHQHQHAHQHPSASPHQPHHHGHHHNHHHHHHHQQPEGGESSNKKHGHKKK
ncbi:disintegrin and metalloproteinase domain-containing protein 11-like [Diadema setosum]|uniref:disintegrin and metalloproteinase domain-containing protein 11-like n=1 Tax=Diadema setosum TaxID=31175 RepID=UPI003B3A4A7C